LCPKRHLNTPWLILAISQCSEELQKSPPGSCTSLGHNAFDSGVLAQAAALQTFQCCCRCWGDLRQPGVGKRRLKYEIISPRIQPQPLLLSAFYGKHIPRAPSKGRERSCPFAHRDPGERQNAARGPYPQSGFGVPVRPPPPGYCWHLRGRGKAAPSAGPRRPRRTRCDEHLLPPDGRASLALLLLSPRKQELFF